MERRLAAILVADVVGYSRLMELDESGTLAALKAVRSEVIDPHINAHAGRIFKATGDGVLVEFPSVVNAVACAVDIQQVMAARNASPEGQKIQLRIGVNLGDVVVEGEDLLGDGINIAARLERLASPGGVAISGMVRDHLGNRLDLTFDDKGDHALKNISKHVRVYEAVLDAPSQARVTKANTDPEARERPSIAVLPFNNMSGDPEQEYFSDGITEDIITELSRSRFLLVIARNSSFHYKGKSPKIADVSRELGVDYVVEGSVRKVGERVRVTVQLIDGASGTHLWAERYDRRLDDIFAVQDDIVRTIAATLPGRIEDARGEHAIHAPTDSLPAYDQILRGYRHLRLYRRRENPAARAAFNRAIELDPRSARAQAGLAMTHIYDFFWGDDLAGYKIGLEIGERALSLDRDEPWAHWVTGLALVKNGRHDESCRLLERASAISPGSADIAAMKGICLVHAGYHERAIPSLNLAIRLDPFQPDWALEFLGVAQLLMRRPSEAIAAFGRILDPPSWISAHMAACHGFLGEKNAADQQRATYLRILGAEHEGRVTPAMNEAQMRGDIASYMRQADREVLIAGFTKAGIFAYRD
jgi:adenylate cyclase